MMRRIRVVEDEVLGGLVTRKSTDLSHGAIEGGMCGVLASKS